ncbi:plasmid mobilization protein [Leisingera aquaemixtae]|uniref:plasmid mobilization protein n=1 Tax=Leisingera aquaemixtae TaxID=1396826 RepID=UPI000B2364FB|nr:hypothetical protein [Leisingera aquaemixtae]
MRLTSEERARLEELAAGTTLSAYIRACVFAKEEKRRRHRPKSVVTDKKAAAEALAMLGQSRIASNLNQLAYHANIGALMIGEREKAQIAEAYAHVLSIRSLLMQALGKHSAPPGSMATLPRSAQTCPQSRQKSLSPRDAGYDP